MKPVRNVGNHTTRLTPVIVNHNQPRSPKTKQATIKRQQPSRDAYLGLDADKTTHQGYALSADAPIDDKLLPQGEAALTVQRFTTFRPTGRSF